MNSQNDIFFEERDAIGIATLNRPQALNALNLSMIRKLSQQLTIWEKAQSIHAVIIQSTGEKAFCAGGDIRDVYYAKHQGKTNIHEFFAEEYSLNQQIKFYSKPYIAIMNGITMGGGAGISINGNYRVATERLIFAMPETGIGFFPDVGGTYFLSHCPDNIGIYLGLTGAKLNAAEANQFGFVDYIIPHTSITKLIENLQSSTVYIPDVLKQYSLKQITFDDAPALKYRDEIKVCFSAQTIEGIIENLNKQGSIWSKEVVKTLLQKSPTSLKVTLKQLHLGKHIDFASCMKLEYRLAKHFLDKNDFYEGIRATIIDKDQKPQWHPISIEEVDKSIVESYFSH